MQKVLSLFLFSALLMLCSARQLCAMHGNQASHARYCSDKEKAKYRCPRLYSPVCGFDYDFK